MSQSSTIGKDFTLVALGIAIGIPLVTFGPTYAANNFPLIVTLFVSIFFVISIVGAVLIIFHQKILHFLIGSVSSDIDTVIKESEALIHAFNERDTQKSIRATAELTRVTIAYISSAKLRRWIVGVVLALLGLLITLLGSSLILKQNEILNIQTEKLQKQNDMLQAQNELLGSQNLLVKQQIEDSSRVSKQSFTLQLADPNVDPEMTKTFRSTIGLRQYRDLLGATNFDLFDGPRNQNIQLMYAIRNWYLKVHFPALESYLSRILICVNNGSCDKESASLLVCPVVSHLIVKDEKWVTWDEKREPFADPFFPINQSKTIIAFSEICPIESKISMKGMSDLNLFRSSAQFGNMKYMFDQFEGYTGKKLPLDKAQSRDNSRIEKFLK